MDLRLPLLADANLHLNVAEEAVQDGAMITAAHELEKAETALDELRELWPEFGENERGLLTSMAKPLGDRVSKIKKQLPVTTSLVSEAAVEEDPEQELDPEDGQ